MWFVLLCVAFAAPIASAQLKGRYDQRVNLSPFPYHVSTFGTQEQLPQNQVTGILKDPLTGQIIISTANGIVEFNGYRFGEYRSNLAYRNYLFVELYSSPQFDHLLGETFIGDVYLLENEPRHLGKYSAVDIQYGHTVFMDPTGEVRFRKNEWSQAKVIQTGLVDATFIKWIDDDVFLISDKTRTYRFALNISKLEFVMDDAIYRTLHDSLTGTRYHISRSTLYKEQNGAITPITLPIESEVLLQDIELIDTGLIVTSNAGLFLIFGDFTFRFSESDVLPTNALDKIFYDRDEDVIFIGTSNKGLIKLTKKKIVNFYDVSDLFLGSFGSLVFDDGSVYAVAGNKIVNTQMMGSFKVLEFDFPENPISSLSIYADTIYVGYWGNGIYAMSKKDGRKIFEDTFDENAVFATYIDRDGQYWLARSDGIATGPTLNSITRHLPETIGEQMTTIYESMDGNLWFGGRKGIVVLGKDREVIRTFGAGDGLNSIDVRAFFEDEEGKMWIGTYAGGLYCYTNGNLISLKSKPNYLLGDDVFTLAPDQFGYLHITSNNGMMLIHQDALNAFLDGQTDYLVPYILGEQTGILNTEFNGGFFNNHININRTYFYYPSIQGVVQYTASRISAKKTNLQISGVFLDGEKMDRPEVIPRQTQFLRVDFFDLNFSELHNVYYQYKLAGTQANERWSSPQKETFVSLFNLEPGDYTLLVRTINASNDLNPPTVSYAFRVQPYFYEMVSFRLLVLLSGILMAGFVFRRRILLKQRALQREMEVSNTITELELNAIHAQMNPHLIFNSLNVLVHLIRSKSLEKAENFTVDFAQLLRNILERSGDQYIEIDKEIQILTNYLQIQSIRYQDAFEYRISCDPQLYQRRIPTMLVQPFVENAIIHGLAHKQGLGRLDVRFMRVDAGIGIEIEDDGIGRKRADEINRGKKRTSMGIQLVLKKLELLRVKYGMDISFEVLDATSGSQTGTLVRIVMASKGDANTNVS